MLTCLRPSFVWILIKGIRLPSKKRKKEKQKEWGTCLPMWNQKKSNLLPQTLHQIKSLYQEWKTHALCRGAYAQQQQMGGILQIPTYCRQGAGRTSWVPVGVPCWRQRLQGLQWETSQVYPLLWPKDETPNGQNLSSIFTHLAMAGAKIQLREKNGGIFPPTV